MTIAIINLNTLLLYTDIYRESLIRCCNTIIRKDTVTISYSNIFVDVSICIPTKTMFAWKGCWSSFTYQFASYQENKGRDLTQSYDKHPETTDSTSQSKTKTLQNVRLYNDYGQT